MGAPGHIRSECPTGAPVALAGLLLGLPIQSGSHMLGDFGFHHGPYQRTYPLVQELCGVTQLDLVQQTTVRRVPSATQRTCGEPPSGAVLSFTR
jgi:hypothetical protein